MAPEQTTTCGDWRATGHLGALLDLQHPASGMFYLAYSVVRSTAADYFDVDNYVVTAASICGPVERAERI